MKKTTIILLLITVSFGMNAQRANLSVRSEIITAGKTITSVTLSSFPFSVDVSNHNKRQSQEVFMKKRGWKSDESTRGVPMQVILDTAYGGQLELTSVARVVVPALDSVV